MAKADFKSWLDGIEPWIASPPRRVRRWREDLSGVRGIVEVGFNQHPQTANAAYLIHSPDFDRIVHGKVSNAGMLVLQGGSEREPFRQAVARPEDHASIRHLIDTIEAEAPHFFRAFPNLRAVYSELVASEPKYGHIHPHPTALSLRQMHAAAVAFLIGEEWQGHIDAALKSWKLSGRPEWILEVKGRLEAAA